MLLKYLPVIFLFLVMVSCTKGPLPNTPPIDTTSEPPTDTSVDNENADIYFAGDSIEPRYVNPVPVYWKNDSLHVLPNTITSSAVSLAFNGNDMYMGCSYQYTGNYIAYWKNGTGVNITSNKFTEIAHVQVAVSNNNVYFAGLAQTTPDAVNTPAYWKNNDSFSIIPLVYILQPNYITCLTVAGSDVYIGGSSALPPPSLYTTYGAAYWKNGNPVYLHNNDTITSTSTVNALVVSDTDVYAAGTTRYIGSNIPHALYWKNGKPHYLTTGNEGSVANAIAIVGNDVYVGGGIIGDDEFPRAAYWKNGKLTQLDTIYSVVNAIAIHKSNVYAAGMHGNYETAAWWKNGHMKLLQPGHIYAMAIRDR